MQQRIDDVEVPAMIKALRQCSKEDMEKFILKRIKEQPDTFKKVMEAPNPPFSDFFKIVLSLYPRLAPQIAPQIFVKVCRNYNQQELVVSIEMIMDSMQYLTKNIDDKIAAQGLLHLAYQNDIGFTILDAELLKRFEMKYMQAIVNFIAAITENDRVLQMIVPPTCFIFTQPMFATLKLDFTKVRASAPSSYLATYFKILCYSFENEYSRFKAFVQACENLFSAYGEKIVPMGFHLFLAELLKLT
jgi:hypothetical protein